MKQFSYEQTANATQAAEAENNKGVETANVSYGKFNDLSSLLYAYNSLEAEFTRRSQKLRDLEGENALLKDELAKNAEASANGLGHAGEGSAYSDIDYLIGENPDVGIYAQKMSGAVGSDGKNEPEGKEFVLFLVNSLKEAENNLSNKDFLLKKIEDTPELGKLIIEDYLRNLKNSKPSAALIGKGGTAVTVPPYRPKSLAEASALAENLIKR